MKHVLYRVITKSVIVSRDPGADSLARVLGVMSMPHSQSLEATVVDKGRVHDGSISRNGSGTRIRPRVRVPEAWRGPPHNKLYGAGPVNSHLVKFNLKLSV